MPMEPVSSKFGFETHRRLTRTWPNRKGKCLIRTSKQVPNPDFPGLFLACSPVFRVPNPDLAKNWCVTRT